jgi:hypothetical protein
MSTSVLFRESPITTLLLLKAVGKHVVFAVDLS